MAITENILDSRPSTDRHMSLMRAASGANEIVDAMNQYLATWSMQKIDNLQKIDGGWGPFDRDRQPIRLSTVADVLWIRETVCRHRVALQEAGIAPNPELVELDQFCFVAGEVARDRIAARPLASSAALRLGAYLQLGNSRSIDRRL